MYRRVFVQSALSIVVGVCCAACSADGEQSDWDIGDQLADVSSDVAQSDAPEAGPIPDVGDDASDTNDAGDGGPIEADCPVGEVLYPAETLPQAWLSFPPVRKPEMVWSKELEAFDRVAEPNGPLAMGRGMMHDHESVDVLVVPSYAPPTADEVASLYRFEMDANTGERWGAGGAGAWSGEYESQIDGLPAPMLFTEIDTVFTLGAAQATPDNDNPRFQGRLDVDLSVRSEEWGTGSHGASVGGLSSGTMPLISHAVVLPNGRGAVVWDGRQVVGLRKTLVNPSIPTYPTPSWTLNLDELWPNAPEGTELTWIKSPSANEMLVHARHFTQEGEPEPDRLFRIDSCGNHEQVLEADGIGEELLKIGDDYLVRTGAREETTSGSTPVLVADGQISASLDTTCRDIVQTDTDRFACLGRQADDSGFEVVYFDDTLSQVDTEALDPGYTYARLWTAADGGLVLLALTEQDDQTPAGHLLLIYTDRQRSYELPEEQDWEPTRADIDRAWPVLTQRGVVAMAWNSMVLGIQTAQQGMARTPFPRAYFGGNHNRGYIDVEP